MIRKGLLPVNLVVFLGGCHFEAGEAVPLSEAGEAVPLSLTLSAFIVVEERVNWVIRKMLEIFSFDLFILALFSLLKRCYLSVKI